MRRTAPTASRPVWAVAASLLLALAAGCRPQQPEAVATDPSTVAEEIAKEAPAVAEWAIAIHGGAGVIERDDLDVEAYYESLSEALRTGARRLAEGAAAVEVVEQVVALLEDDPKFNAGRGAVYTNRGTHELDAAIMDGRTLACGAVAGVRNVKNPIRLARQIMERSPHVLLAGEGADAYSREVGVTRVQQSYFHTQRRLDQWRRARAGGNRAASREPGDAVDPVATGRREPSAGRLASPASLGSNRDLSTVGAVALDRYGNLAAATSTGGLTDKRFGRVGDVPIIGAGTYANNETAALSGTGKGEEFIRHAVAHDISARMAYRGATLEQAATEVIDGVLAEGDGGVIGVDRNGALVLAFNTPGMFRGAADSLGRLEVGIWRETRALEPRAATP